jgi:hypothetical protein
MGYYINPKNETKESFLEREAVEITEEEFNESVFTDQKYNVCLVDNGVFTAAIICFCEGELDYIQRANKTDYRPKKFYRVNANKLEEFLV